MSSSQQQPKILVVGAGVNGLACAVCIQKCCPQALVEIVADKFSPDTTSEISAGFWGPFLLGNTDPELIDKLSKATHEYLLDIALSPLAGEVGAQQLSGYFLFSDVVEDDKITKRSVDGYRKLSQEELARFPSAKSGFFYTTVQVDVTPYLQWLTKRFTEKGGHLHCRKLASLEEFAGQYDLVINCSGLGARDLVKDDQVFPTGGVVWRVYAPWIKHFYALTPKFGQAPTYILPGIKNIVVGGTSQVGDWNTEVDEETSKSIWHRALHLMPALEKATPIKVNAGLRPSRTKLRLESEVMDVDGKQLKVVHNYGHGGGGITLHWGCALEVTKLALESLGYPINVVQQVHSRL